MRDPESANVDGAIPSSEAKRPRSFRRPHPGSGRLHAGARVWRGGRTDTRRIRPAALLRESPRARPQPRHKAARRDSGPAVRAAFDRSVDVMVGRLRRKIEPDPKAPRLIVKPWRAATSSPPNCTRVRGRSPNIRRKTPRRIHAPTVTINPAVRVFPLWFCPLRTLAAIPSRTTSLTG